MTREEAAKILDPETTLDAYAKISYYGGFEGESAWQDAVNEACRMGAEALRALDAQEKQESFGEWISVKDRLPDADGIYLVCDRRLNGVPWVHTAGFKKTSSSWCESHGMYYDDR